MAPSSGISSAGPLLLIWGLVCVIMGPGCEGCTGAHGPREPRGGGPLAPTLWRDPLPGTAAAPIPVGVLPFTDEGNTELVGSPHRSRDRCAPAVVTPGPEVHYALEIDEEMVLAALLESRRGMGPSLSLLTEAGYCMARASRVPGEPGSRDDAAAGPGGGEPAGAREVKAVSGPGKIGKPAVAVALERRLRPGRYLLVVDSRAAGGGPYRLDVFASAPQPRQIGSFWNTFYYVAEEADHEPPADTPLLSADCDLLAEVPRSFHDDLCIEGSGRLADGRVVNYAASCTKSCFAAVTCGRRSYKICYQVLDGSRYPWGMGAAGRALVPDISIAVDPRQVPLGTVLYVPELDGVRLPGHGGLHDGCVRADDVGGAIKGNHFDLFVATRARWRAWERITPTYTYFTLVRHHSRCVNLPGTAGGGLPPPTPEADPGGGGAEMERRFPSAGRLHPPPSSAAAMAAPAGAR